MGIDASAVRIVLMRPMDPTMRDTGCTQGHQRFQYSGPEPDNPRADASSICRRHHLAQLLRLASRVVATGYGGRCVKSCKNRLKMKNICCKRMFDHVRYLTLIVGRYTRVAVLPS